MSLETENELDEHSLFNDELEQTLSGGEVFTFNISNQSIFKDGYKYIINKISDPSDIPTLKINKKANNTEYFIIQYYYYDDFIQLIFRTTDFYLLGFVGESNIYYYFSDSSVTKLPTIVNEQNLGYSGSYITLGMPGSYTHANLGSYITMLNQFNGKKSIAIQKALSTIVYSTAEAFRFKSVAVALIKIIDSSNSLDSSLYEDDVKNWQILSQKALNNDSESIKKVNIAKKY